MNEKYKNTKMALKHFRELLFCSVCKSRPVAAKGFLNCKHFICSVCMERDQSCAICKMPIRLNELESNVAVMNIKSCIDIIENIVNKTSSPVVEITNQQKITSPPEGSSKYSQSGRRSASGRIPKNLEKRNVKGETSMHFACVQGNEERVKMLLEAGASPNTKDNADWTPLQEAANFGFYGICKLLLDAGAKPDTPGYDNKTALHEAVSSEHHNVVELLLSYNACTDVFDKYGKTPLDYCESEKIRETLLKAKKGQSDGNHSVLDRSLNRSICSTKNNKMILFASNLSDETQKLFSQLCAKYKIKSSSTFRSGVTHVIVEVNSKNLTKLTFEVLRAILHGMWLLESDWIQLSLESELLSEDISEVYGTLGAPVSTAPSRARENAEKQNLRLFNGCSFFFALAAQKQYYVGDLILTKEELVQLVHDGEGINLTREPDPEDVKASTQIVPFHVAHNQNHPLRVCSHYIIYAPGEAEPKIKYNMPHIKSLPLLWFIESIEKFEILDPSVLGL